MAITMAATLDDSVIALMDQAFLLESADNIVIDQFVDYKKDIGAKSIDLPKFAKLDKVESALTDGTEATAVAQSDTKVTLTPAEYGNVVTNTRLANLQTGGKADLAAAKNIAINMVESSNRLGCLAAQASTNILIANSVALEASLVATDVIQATDLDYVHNRLYRKNIAMFPGEAYVAIAHPDVISSIKTLSGFEDVMKYANPQMMLKNEIGMYKGFRWVSTNGVKVNADAGSGTVDTYDTIYLGRNALGKAVSFVTDMVYAPARDNLNRLINIGWYGVFQYGIIDQDALWITISGSPYGDNS